MSSLTTGIILDAESVRAEVAEAPDTHNLAVAEAAWIDSLDDDLINQIIYAEADDDFYEQYDALRRKVIARLAHENRKVSL